MKGTYSPWGVLETKWLEGLFPDFVFLLPI